MTELEAEVSRLKGKLAKARMERTSLKKFPRTLRRRSGSVRAQENARLEVVSKVAPVRTWQICGPERLQAEVREDGFPAGSGGSNDCARNWACVLTSPPVESAQYCAQAYQATLRRFGMIPSMSRKGNCYDNAPMERFWSTLKTELGHHRRDENRGQAQCEAATHGFYD